LRTAPRTVLTIGNFDGVHAGHIALLRRARAIADAHPERPRVVALAFSPHPLSVLAPGREPATLTTFATRERTLLAEGADAVMRLDPTEGLLERTAEEFVESLVREFAPVAIVEGGDFHFGKARRGNIDTLRALGERHSFAVEVVPPVTVRITDSRQVPASSTLARWMISHGRVADAAAVLTRLYSITGEVVRGARRGRELGVPTANIRTPCLPPGEGVYAGRATLPDRSVYSAAISVGTNPTFGEHQLSVEAHILDWSGFPDDAHEYGWSIELSFDAWLRDQLRFESIDALKDQMWRDIDRARAITTPLIHSGARP
jgi:riboflavin kinase/FMN adenylyltransferase